MLGMQRTLVSRDDVARPGRRAMSQGGTTVMACKIAKLTNRHARVVEHWSEPGIDRQWFDVPAVHRRWALKVSGDPDVDFRRYVAGRFLSDGRCRRALSIGCGFGGRERAWAALDVFDELVGVDMAPAAVAGATQAAREEGFDPRRLRFEEHDLSEGSLTDTEFDVIIAEHSLHHFTDVAGTVRRIRDALAPGGLFVMDEYVGPSRFQLTARQVEAADGLLRALPQSHRRLRNGRVKRAVRRPSLVAMRFDDPSEAVESARIMPAVHGTFSVVHEAGYGGALLHPLLANIAQHFIDDDPPTLRLLGVLFDAEDALLASGEIEHDFVAGVYRVR